MLTFWTIAAALYPVPGAALAFYYLQRWPWTAELETQARNCPLLSGFALFYALALLVMAWPAFFIVALMMEDEH